MRMELTQAGACIVRTNVVQTDFYYGVKGFPRGEFTHAWYEVCGTPEQLIWLGVCRPSSSNKTGITPRGMSRVGGRVHVQVQAGRVIRHDERFNEAMKRVLDGAECPDFALPQAPKRKRRDPGGEPA
jgi:hypothetical protein